MIEPKDKIRASRQAMVDALTRAKADITKDSSFKCCFHEDRTPSAGIFQKEGVWRFKCHGCNFGGDVFDVIARSTGKSVEDQLKELSGKSEDKKKPIVIYPTLAALQAAVARQNSGYELEETYQNTNPETGKADMIVLRLRNSSGEKTCRFARPQNGGFAQKAPAKPWPLYGRNRIAKLMPEDVVVVEGEKCVHAIAGAGIVGATNHDGALSGHHTDWGPLAKVKTVYLWPDHDAIDAGTGKRKGHEHMKQVATLLAKLEPAPRVMWIDPEFLGLDEDGSDVVDYLAEYGGDTVESRAAAIQCALATATPIGGSSDLADFIDDAIAGRRRTVAFPWPHLTRLTRALMPGTVTCICGDPGAGKSLLVIEAGWWWHRQGVKIAIFMLEEDRSYHLARALAQLEENSDLTDAEWILANPEKAKAAYANHRDLLDTFGPRIDAAPDAAPNHVTLLVWIKQRAEAGCRVIIIDPVTAAAVSEKPWLDDLNFLTVAKNIMREHGASLVLTTHPRKGRKRGTGLDDLAGGAAYPRFAQTVFWLVKHDKPMDVRVSGPCGPFTARINRSIRIGKTRNGPGGGMELAYLFDPGSLRFSEQGIVVGDADEPAQTEDPFANNTPAEQSGEIA